MANRSTERASKETGKKGKPGCYYEQVPPSKDTQGASERELGTRWGRDTGKSDGEGRVTRKGSQTQTIPGTLDTAQEEQEGRPEESSLDQPLSGGGDRPNLDQSAPADDDRLNSEGLDQPENSGVDRPEGRSPDERRLSYASSDDEEGDRSERGSPVPPPSGKAWKRVGKKKRVNVRSEASEVEGDLLATGSDNENTGNEAKYFKEWFSNEEDEGNNDSKGEDEEESEPGNSQKPEGPAKRGRRKRGRQERQQDRKGKQPVRPAGYQELMSSISMAGQRETVPRTERIKAPTAVTFGRNKNNIPHGLKFNAGKPSRASANQEKPGPGSDSSSDHNSSDENEHPVRGRKRTPANKGGRKSKPSPSGSSASSSNQSGDSSSSASRSVSSSSHSSSGDSSGGHRGRRRKHRSKRKDRKRKGKRSGRKESKAEREERKAMERHKVTAPSVYDGKPDLMVFDKWTYEVNNWVRLGKYRDVTALRLLVSYVSGEAGEFFMNFVANNERSWTINTMYEALFDYCFPMDFKDRLRARLTHSIQGKRRIRDFVRDVERLAARFPDVNERAVIQTVWNGMRQSIRLRLIEWGISAENTPLARIVRKAMDIEASEETYRREAKNNQPGPPERSWGRFANRTGGPQRWKPSGEGEGSESRPKSDRVRANAVSPQHSNEQGRPQERGHQKRGRRISRAKRDQLRAAGKCFQCEEAGHDQRNCPKLHSMRRPEVNAVELARRERLTKPKDAPNLRVSSVGLTMEGESIEDDATDSMRRAYELCANEWGVDDSWLDVQTRLSSRYGIYQYGTGSGDLVEIFDESRPEMGFLEVATSRLSDPNFRLADVHATGANTDLSCIREGG
jgi:hypothetical protein